MSGATLILIVNLCVGALFTGAFVAIAAYGKSYRSAAWWVGVYGFCVLAYVTEFLLPLNFADRALYELGFMSYLAAFYCGAIAVFRRYDITPPWRLMGVWFVLFSLLNVFTYDLPRNNLIHQIGYQWPLGIAYVFAFYAAWKYGHSRLDRLIMGIAGFGIFYFLTKPAFAVMLHAGVSEVDYLQTAYAAWSQTSGAVLLVGQGVAFIVVYMLDIIEDLKAVSFTDGLSGLLNRRGFSVRVESLRAQIGRSASSVVVMADLDHFKLINDTYGHAVGDEVIESFSDLMRDFASNDHILARAGGEEFVMFLGRATETSGRLFAESMRMQFAHVAIKGLPADKFITASFGVAELEFGESLGKAIDRADMALYAAKRAGRNRVKVASQIVTTRSAGAALTSLSSEGRA